jgi:hypothetical protein
MTKRLSTDERYGNRYLMPQVIEHEPRIEGQVVYAVITPRGIRFTQCRPAPAQDSASCTPTTRGMQMHHRGSLNHGEGAE